jgi:hypothetical protein
VFVSRVALPVLVDDEVIIAQRDVAGVHGLNVGRLSGFVTSR